jgi:hypothetical protein
MISEGTEFMHTKRVDDVTYDSEGRPVTYNRPDLNQLDWRRAGNHADLTDAIGKLIALRKRLPHFKYRRALREGQDITWLYPRGYPHNDNVNALGYVLRPPPGQRAPKGFGEARRPVQRQQSRRALLGAGRPLEADRRRREHPGRRERPGWPPGRRRALLRAAGRIRRPGPATRSPLSPSGAQAG